MFGQEKCLCLPRTAGICTCWMTYSYMLFNFSCSLLTVYLYVVDMLFLNWNWTLCVQDILKFYFMYFKTHFINVWNFLLHFGHWKLLLSMENLKYYYHYKWHMIILSSWLWNKLVSQKREQRKFSCSVVLAYLTLKVSMAVCHLVMIMAFLFCC